MTSKPQSRHTLYCQVQNRLGALDRVLGALTHRGILPNQFICQQEDNAETIQVIMVFDSEDAKLIEKMVKFLNNQVLVLEVLHMVDTLEDTSKFDTSETKDEFKLPDANTPPTVPGVTSLLIKRMKERKLPHVHIG